MLRLVPATVVVGAQWGDEGKGKIVDLLAQQSDLVCRYQGGPNTGHTIVVGDDTFKIRQIPTGIINRKPCVIGNGCVIDPEVLIEELDRFEALGYPTSEVYVSGNAHLIMPWHVAIDQASERRLGRLQIGTTKRGVGPAYADKASRIGIRVQDVLDPKILRQKIEVALAEKNLWLERIYEVEPFDLEDVAIAVRGVRAAAAAAHRATPRSSSTRRCAPAARCSSRARRRRCSTSTTARIRSSRRRTRARRARRSGPGIGPTRIDTVIGVAKAYVTRVGEGPFPSEIDEPEQTRVRELGGEFGTVTGRNRRCGWLDLVALRYAVRVNGIDRLALTKLDVLSHFAEVPVCVRYALPDGTESEHFPAHQSDFHAAKPVYETLPGWEEPLDTCSSADELPAAARDYVEFVERELDVEVALIGTGAERESVLTRA